MLLYKKKERNSNATNKINSNKKEFLSFKLFLSVLPVTYFAVDGDVFYRAEKTNMYVYPRRRDVIKTKNVDILL